MENNSLVETASNAIADVVKPIYDDLAHPAAQETGKAIARIPRFLNALCVNFDIWILRREHNEKMVNLELDAQFQNVPQEKIVEPDPYVAVPAMQAISISYDSIELRSMYAHLLSKSMHIDYKNDVHPSFVEIIKQLSPIDCMVFKELMSIDENPILTAILYKEGEVGPLRNYEIIHTNLNDLSSCSYEQSKISLDNLNRLNLIEIRKDLGYSNKDIYLPIINSPFCLELKSKYGQRLDFQENSILKNNFSYLFHRICVSDLS